MASPKQALKEDENALTTQQNQVPATMDDEVADLAVQDAGRGASQSSDDKFFPLISIVHKLSPQAEETAPEYIEGAKQGDIYFRNFSPPIVSGTEGILVQPCKLYLEYVEWVPRERGGGMAGRYLTKPKEARVGTDGFKMTMPNGNELRETRVWVVNYYDPSGGVTPLLIPCASTLNTFARAWNTSISQKKEANGAESPAWRYLWRLTTKPRKNIKGSWATYAVNEERKVTSREEYLRGRDLCESVEKALARGDELAKAADYEQASKGVDDDRM